MLEKIFGNKTAEKVLLYLYHYGESHAAPIAKEYQLPYTPIKYQLERFEEAGVLISRGAGRSRIYQFNPKSSILKPLKEMVRIAYESIPLKERVKIFASHRKPRRKGKPVL
jgi:hypothetical protein